MKRDLPKFVYRKGVKGYAYYCRRGAKPVRIRSEPGTDEFWAEYALLLKGRQPTPAKTFSKLIASYKASPQWARLAANTKKSYGRHFDFFERKIGNLDPRTFKQATVIAMQTDLADKPTDANRKVACLSVLFKHAIRLGWQPKDFNPAKGVDALDPPKPPREPWPADKIAAFRAVAPPLPRLIFELLLGTGQRIGDVLAMRWDQITEGGIPVKQRKTGTWLFVPFTKHLKAVIEATPIIGATIVSQPNGKPVGYSTAARDMLAVRKAIGAEAWDQHALRHSAASEIAALPGMTLDHVKAITGHSSDDMARLYAGRASQKARAKEAQRARGEDDV